MNRTQITWLAPTRPRAHAWDRPEPATGPSSVTLRPARPTDAADLTAMLTSLSLQSAFHRFLAGLRRPSPQLVARLLLRDDRHGAWLAVDRREFVVGHVLWALDGEVVDLGVVVADAWQGRGVGRQLIQVAMSEATAAGARAVEVDVHLENRRMLRLLRTILPGATVTYEADLVTLQASLAAPRRKIA